MSEIRFYHLQNQSVEQALPALVAKAYENGHRIVIKTPDAQISEKLNEVLWTYQPASFLPHGTQKDGQAERQPVWITHENENPNKADVLMIAGGTEGADAIEGITLQCEMFHGQYEAEVEAARARWAAYKEADHSATYWQQNERGGWDKKA